MLHNFSPLSIFPQVVFVPDWSRLPAGWRARRVWRRRETLKGDVFVVWKVLSWANEFLDQRQLHNPDCQHLIKLSSSFRDCWENSYRPTARAGPGRRYDRTKVDRLLGGPSSSSNQVDRWYWPTFLMSRLPYVVQLSCSQRYVNGSQQTSNISHRISLNNVDDDEFV